MLRKTGCGLITAHFMCSNVQLLCQDAANWPSHPKLRHTPEMLLGGCWVSGVSQVAEDQGGEAVSGEVELGVRGGDTCRVSRQDARGGSLDTSLARSLPRCFLVHACEQNMERPIWEDWRELCPTLTLGQEWRLALTLGQEWRRFPWAANLKLVYLRGNRTDRQKLLSGVGSEGRGCLLLSLSRDTTEWWCPSNAAASQCKGEEHFQECQAVPQQERDSHDQESKSRLLSMGESKRREPPKRWEINNVIMIVFQKWKHEGYYNKWSRLNFCSKLCDNRLEIYWVWLTTA